MNKAKVMRKAEAGEGLTVAEIKVYQKAVKPEKHVYGKMCIRDRVWRETFITKIVLAYGTVFSVNIFVLLLPMITKMHIDGAVLLYTSRCV